MKIIDLNTITDGDERTSFHIFSETYFRGEIKIYKANFIANDYCIKDNLLIFLLKGNVKFIINNINEFILTDNMQILLTENESFKFEVLSKSIMEWIWGPGLYIS